MQLGYEQQNSKITIRNGQFKYIMHPSVILDEFLRTTLVLFIRAIRRKLIVMRKKF